MSYSINNILGLLTSINDEKLNRMIRIAVPKTKYLDLEEMKDTLSNYTICVWDLEYKESWGIDEEFLSVSEGIKYTGPCDRPLDQMVISSNGDVSICCRDWNHQNVLGNVYEDSIYDIWHCEEMRKIQQLISNQDYDKIECCRDCNMNNSFYKRIRKRSGLE